MPKFPETPFLTKNFAIKGGGIDFLGTRLVNLQILGEYLIPGLNNQTKDIGTYCIGSWLPWKFTKLCETGNRENDFIESNYKRYREVVEVCISHSMRDFSPSCIEYGKPSNRMGNNQKVNFTTQLNFKDSERTNATSLYAAPLYGPSLNYLALITPTTLSKDEKAIKIPVAQLDKKTQFIVSYVDDALKNSKCYGYINQLQPQIINSDDIDDLGIHGLNPAFYRKASSEFKKAFISKLLPDVGSSGKGRTLTAKLIVETLKCKSPLSLEDIRTVWHSGILPSGKELKFKNHQLLTQRNYWSIFLGRQHQRFILELYLRCFELALLAGCKSIEEIVNYWVKLWSEYSKYSFPETFIQLLLLESEWLPGDLNFIETSKFWNERVHGEHSHFDWIDYNEDNEEFIRACKMLARWYLRTISWPLCYEKEILNKGGPNRISIHWFLKWINSRKELPLKDFFQNLFSELIFSQHIRFALHRFDGKAQRLRFALGDNGIVPTSSAAKKLGKKQPVIMADRLESFAHLLTDLDIIEQNDDKTFQLGNYSKSI
jgi:hypothetical protein